MTDHDSRAWRDGRFACTRGRWARRWTGRLSRSRAGYAATTVSCERPGTGGGCGPTGGDRGMPFACSRCGRTRATGRELLVGGWGGGGWLEKLGGGGGGGPGGGGRGMVWWSWAVALGRWATCSNAPGRRARRGGSVSCGLTVVTDRCTGPGAASPAWAVRFDRAVRRELGRWGANGRAVESFKASLRELTDRCGAATTWHPRTGWSGSRRLA